MKLIKRMLIALLVACSLLLVAPVVAPVFEDAYTVEAASKKINKTNITIGVGSTYKLKIQNNKKKVKWSSSNSKVAKVNKNGTVTGLKKGTVTITAKVGSKKYKCKVKVTKTPTFKTNIKKAYLDKDGDYVVEGYVKNQTYTKLDNTRITVTLYDKKGKKLDETSRYIDYMDARGQWKVKVKIYVGKNANVASYKTTVSGGYFTRSRYNPNITAKVKKLKKDGNSYSTTVKYTNKNNAKLTSMYATYAFYDKKGNIVKTYLDGWRANYVSSTTGKKVKGELGNGLKKNKSFTATNQIISIDYDIANCKIAEAHGYDL